MPRQPNAVRGIRFDDRRGKLRDEKARRVSPRALLSGLRFHQCDRLTDGRAYIHFARVEQGGIVGAPQGGGGAV